MASKTFWQPPAADSPGTRATLRSAGSEAAGAALRRWCASMDCRAVSAALLYVAFGAVWILWSDRLLFGLSSEVAALRALGEWKGLVFVVLSALWVGAVGWRRRDGPADAPAGVIGMRTITVLGIAAVAIVSVGVTGAIHASHKERHQAAEMLRVVAQSRAALWEAWLQERVRDAESRRADAELLQLAARRDADESARRALAAHLRTLCEQMRCAEARIADLVGSERRPPTLTVVGGARAASAMQGGVVEVQAPFEPVAGQPRAALALRFDATAALSRTLGNDAGSPGGMRLLLTRRVVGGWQWLESTPAGGLLGQLVETDELRAWPDLASGAPLAPTGFDAAIGGDQTVIGVAAPAGGGGWTLAAIVDAQGLYQRSWGYVLWIAAADLAALLLVAAAICGLHQRRELLAARRERAEQEEKLRALDLLDAISNSTPDLVFTKDLQGRFTFVNHATCQALGRPAGAVLGSTAEAFFSAEESAGIAALNAQVVESGRVITSEGELTTALGRRWYLRTLGPLREADGRVSGVFGVVHDITERRRQEERQRQWAKAFESTRDGVVICDAQARIESVNRAFTDITGYGAEDAIGRTPALLHSGRHDAAFYRELWACVASDGHWRGEIWNRRKTGEVYPEWLTISTVRDDAGAVVNYVGVFTDITRVKRDEAELQRLANYDPLTELPNRRLLNWRLEQALARAMRHGGRTALLYVDLDGFKTVNDSLGHPAGDELLVRVAQRLKERVRDGDTLGRLGGDEFLVIAESLHGPEDAALLAQDLIAAVACPVPLPGGREAYVTASIGISLFPDDGCADATAMMRDADAAMYRAKEQGRNRFCFFTQDLNAQAIAKLELEVALSQALPRGELLLHYQPKVGAACGRIVGAEALLRWRRGGELVPPGHFIPIAEQSSLILDIGAWVIDEVCAQLARWRAAGLAMPPVAVNVAARQFAAGNLDEVLGDALRRHGVPPDCLEVEVTESMLIDRPAEGIAMLARLRQLGIKLSLDDFGTGYSSLAYLRQFPIDALKIDKSFVDQIESGPDGSAIVDAVIALAHRLGLTVVAEGVETPAQLEHLRAQGCDELQGFGLARPMPAPDFEALCAAAETGRGVSSRV